MAGPFGPWKQLPPHMVVLWSVANLWAGITRILPRILAQGFSSVGCPPLMTEKSGKEPGGLAAVGFLCDVSDVTLELGSCV